LTGSMGEERSGVAFNSLGVKNSDILVEYG
jgi:hypothetical protein